MADKRIIELANETTVLSDDDYTIVDSENGTTKFKLKRIVNSIPAIDSTLTQEGKAADAKATGDAIAGVKSDLSDINERIDNEVDYNGMEWTTGGYIDCTQNTLPNVSASSNFSYINEPCNPGDIFIINAKSITTRGTFAFWDSDGNKIINSTVTPIDDLFFVAPAMSARITINTSDISYTTYKGLKLTDKVKYLENDVADITGLEVIRYTNGYYQPIATGSIARIGANASYKTAIVPCTAGDIFTISGTAGNAAKLYGFYDSTFTNVEVGSILTADNLAIIAPSNSAWLILNDNTGTAVSYKGKRENSSEDYSISHVVYFNESASLAENASVARVAGISDTMNGYSLCARFDITGNVNFRFGLNNTADEYSSGYVIVDDTNVTVNYVTDTLVLEHGLIFNTFIQIAINVSDNARKAELVITTLAGQYVHDIPWRASCGRLQLTNLSATAITNAKTSYHCNSINKDVWAFGDSYFNYCAPLLGELGYTELMLDAKSGRGSVSAMESLQECLAVRKPKVIYWAMGMNDADTNGTVNANWMNTLTQLETICTLYDIELILATIPNTPIIDNQYKNAVVRNSGHTYADICMAVGADISTGWYSGMLRTDNVHPTDTGINAIVQEWVKTMPYIYNRTM